MAAWFNSDWGFRNKITVDNTKVPSDQTDFPMLVSTTDVQWKSTGNGGDAGQTDGGDFAFTDSDGTTQLKHEVEKYDATTGELVAWVKVPTLKGATDTDIFVYYGNATVANQEDVANVWDANYKGVYHLHDDFTDSSGTGNNGTDSGTANIAGQVADARDFDGGTDEITCGTSTTLNPGTGNSFTMSAWIKPPNSSQFGTIGGRRQTISPFNSWWFSIEDGSNSGVGGKKLSFFFRGVATTITRAAFADVDFADGSLHYAVAVVDNPGDTIRLYKDGVNQAVTITTDGAWPSHNRTEQFRIGAMDGGFFFIGLIDEVRVSTTIARTADWITAEFNNQKTPGTFYTVASQEAGSAVLAPIWRRTQTPHVRM